MQMYAEGCWYLFATQHYSDTAPLAWSPETEHLTDQLVRSPLQFLSSSLHLENQETLRSNQWCGAF